jgi:hypothetical protein
MSIPIGVTLITFARHDSIAGCVGLVFFPVSISLEEAARRDGAQRKAAAEHVADSDDARAG